MRIKTFIGVVSVLLATALAGCGGGSSDDASPGKASAASKADVDKLLEQTFGPNPKANSGMLNGRIDIKVTGVRRFRLPIAVTVTGPFNQAGGDAPEANLSVGLELRGTALGGELVLIGDRALIGVGSTGYQIPDAISNRLRRPLADADNGLGAVLAVFGVAPRRWAKNARIVGNEKIAGVDTIHGTAAIDTRRFFLDVAKLTKTLTSLRITDIADIPRAVDGKARAALVRSVKTATGDVYSGVADHVMRRARLNIKLETSPADRKLLGGIKTLSITGGMDVTEVGTHPKVEAPSSTGSYAELQVALDAIEEAARRDRDE